MSAAAAVLRQIVVIGSDPAVVCFRLFPGFFGQPPGFGRRRGVFDQTGIAADFFRRMARRFQPVGFRLLVRRTEKFSVFQRRRRLLRNFAEVEEEGNGAEEGGRRPDDFNRFGHFGSGWYRVLCGQRLRDRQRRVPLSQPRRSANRTDRRQSPSAAGIRCRRKCP